MADRASSSSSAAPVVVEEPATDGSRAPRPHDGKDRKDEPEFKVPAPKLPLAKRMVSPPPTPRGDGYGGKRPKMHYDPATDPDLDLPILFSIRCEDKKPT